MKLANRLSKIPVYIFSRVDELKKRLISSGIDIIDLGIGDPDIKTPDFIVKALEKSIRELGFHNYPPYSGIDEFRRAVASYYKKRFNVELDYEKEVVALIGSKEGIANLFLALTDEGDYVILPDPSYPVYDAAARIAGCNIYKMILSERNNYLPKIENIYPEVARKAKIILVNYPNNPTGAAANINFYRNLVEFGIKNDISVVNDGAYIDILKDNCSPVSLLQVEEAKRVCVEFGTLSKSYSMTGWRIGYAVGNSEILKKLMVIKTNSDSGQFIPIQQAGAEAIEKGNDFVEYINNIYNKRREIVVNSLKGIGLNVYDSCGTFYVWLKVPKKYKSEEFCQYVLENTGVIITPGNAYGTFGEGYCRISLTIEDERIKEAMNRLSNLNF